MMVFHEGLVSKCGDIMKSLSQSNQNNLFYLQYTNASEVIKVIKNVRNDCSTGYENIPVSFSKLVVPNSIYFV